MPSPYTHCPKCGHQPLPADQTMPAACPACGVILAKVGQLVHRALPVPDNETDSQSDEPGWTALITGQGEPVDGLRFWSRVLMLVGLMIWGWVLIGLDLRSGAMMASFLHRPLLVFHEAGHIIFMPLGEWMAVMGGTLGQLLMPLILAGALLIKNRDPFGSAVALWFLGVSLLDVAPYMFDALHPHLMLLSGATGEAGGHDWIYLFSSLGLLPKAQLAGGLIHKAGAMVIVVALGWACWLLHRQWSRRANTI